MDFRRNAKKFWKHPKKVLRFPTKIFQEFLNLILFHAICSLFLHRYDLYKG